MKYISYKERRSHGTLDFPFAYYYIDKTHPRYKMILHWHEEVEIIRILKGSMELSLDGVSYDATCGDLLFISSGMLHSAVPKNCVYECLVFDLSFLANKHNLCSKSIMHYIRGERVINLWLPHLEDTIRISIDDLFVSMRKKERGYEFKVLGSIYLLFAEIENHHLYEEKVEFSKFSMQRINQFKKVLHYIELNLSNKITLEELSEIAGYDKKYFCAFFKDISGKTPIEYLNSYRIEYAAEQLSTTKKAISEIAYNSGFQDLSYFSKLFKKYKKFSPKEYRKIV